MTALTRLSASAVAIPAGIPEAPLPAPAAAFLADAAAYAQARAAIAAAPPAEREEMFAGIAPRLPALDARQRAEVARAVEHLEGYAGPVSPGMLAAWLAPINAAVRNPQSRDDLATRVAAMCDLLADLPAGAFTIEARRSMRCEFFPSAAEIRRAVEPGANRLRAQIDALRRMNAPPPPADAEPEREEMTHEQRAALADQARKLVAELRGNGTTDGARLPVKPAPLSDGALLALLEKSAAEGNKASAARLATLRARMGAAA